MDRPASAGSNWLEIQHQFGGFTFSINGPQDKYLSMVQRNFSGLDPGSQPSFNIEVHNNPEGYLLRVKGKPGERIVRPEDLLYEIEGMLVPASQLARPGLIFFHAAALYHELRGCLLVGESGAGKSTLTWALTHFGFAYLSDELAPLRRTTVGFEAYPYRHAICLKQNPPGPFSFPPDTFDSGRTWHIPVTELAAGTHHQPMAIQKIFFVSHSTTSAPPQAAPLSRAQAAHRLYPQLLNALAHPTKGLAAVADVAAAAECYALTSSDLTASCKLVQQIMRSD